MVSSKCLKQNDFDPNNGDIVEQLMDLNTKKYSMAQEWWAVHRRYLPFFVVVPIFNILTHAVDRLIVTGTVFWEFQLVEYVIISDLIILPLAAINSIFFLRKALSKVIGAGWPMILLKLFATGFGVALVSSLIEQVYLFIGFVDDDYVIFADHQFSASASNVINNTTVALVLGLPIFIWQHRVDGLSIQLKEKELEQEKLLNLKTQAELHALQSRINPHFLFNSFNSIASLISSNPKKAEKMVVELSNLFRYSLNSEASNFVSIATELQIVETYLGIEKVRFDDRLDYEIEVPSELMDRLIPRFLIQPLVENAVKHGISKVKQGEVKLVFSSMSQKLVIELYDNGPPFIEPMTDGFGLQSTFDKLNLLYPGKHEIGFTNLPEKFVRITLEN